MDRSKITQELQVIKWSNKKGLNKKVTSYSSVPKNTLIINDTSYLDYVADTFKIYSKDAILDPNSYFGNKGATKRYTVSNLRFELVPKLEKYVVALGGTVDFATRGIYKVDGNTLIIQVSINNDELANSEFTGQNPAEDAYIQTALQTIPFAIGSPQQALDPDKLTKVNDDIKSYLTTGLFAHPIKIIDK